MHSSQASLLTYSTSARFRLQMLSDSEAGDVPHITGAGTTTYDYNLKAIVDIGSNGIRFSISSIDPIHARIFPCLYKDRAAISLFDAQHQSADSSSVTHPFSDKKKKKISKAADKQKLKTVGVGNLVATAATAAAIKAKLNHKATATHSGLTSPLVASSVPTLSSGYLSFTNSGATSTNQSTDTEDADVEVEPEDVGPTDLAPSGASTTTQSTVALNALANEKSQITSDDLLKAAEDAARAAASDKNDIPESIIHDVVFALLRFKSVCEDFRVAKENIRVVATEATREAPNSVVFREAIFNATGWEVSLLSKSEEARSGAYGVASSFNAVQGLFMDLGGGSTQLSWISCINGEFTMSESPVSLPYGAAALTRRLGKSTPESESIEDLFVEIKLRLQDAVKTIGIPKDMSDAANASGGYKLYVSGGGFRGLGNLLLARGETLSAASKEPAPYPLPIINGYACTTDPLHKLVQEFNPLKSSASSVLDFARNNSSLSIAEHGASGGGKTKVFRVSERRANQLPAVILLVRALLESLPSIRKVLFSQGGVREGVLFHGLPKEIRKQDPLEVATFTSKPASAHSYLELLLRSIPSDTEHSSFSVPPVIRTRLLKSIANTAFVHSPFPKELQPLAALNIALVGGIADAHGLSHEVRVLLGLALCQRWGGELPEPGLRDSMISILAIRKLAWWALYCGHLMHVIGGVYPGGYIRNLSDDEQPVFSIRADFIADASDEQDREDETEGISTLKLESKKHGKKVATTQHILIRIQASKMSPKTAAPMVRSRINNLEKKLKKLSKEFGKADSCKVHVQINWF